MVAQVELSAVRSSEVVLVWDPPADPQEEVLNYEARFFVKVRLPGPGVLGCRGGM